MDGDKLSSAALNPLQATGASAAKQQTNLASSAGNLSAADDIVARVGQLSKSAYLQLQQLTVDAMDVQFDETHVQSISSKLVLLQNGISQLSSTIIGVKTKNNDTPATVHEQNVSGISAEQSRFDLIIEAMKNTCSAKSIPASQAAGDSLVSTSPVSQQAAAKTDDHQETSSVKNGKKLDNSGQRRFHNKPVVGHQHVTPFVRPPIPASYYYTGPSPPGYFSNSAHPPPVRPPVPLFNIPTSGHQADRELDEAFQCRAVKLRLEGLAPNTVKAHLFNYFKQFGWIQMVQVHDHNVMQMRNASYKPSSIPPSSPIWGFVVMGQTSEVCEILRFQLHQPHMINDAHVRVSLYRNKDGFVDGGKFAQILPPVSRLPARNDNNAASSAGKPQQQQQQQQKNPPLPANHHCRMVADRYRARDGDDAATSSARPSSGHVLPAPPPSRVVSAAGSSPLGMSRADATPSTSSSSAPLPTSADAVSAASETPASSSLLGPATISPAVADCIPQQRGSSSSPADDRSLILLSSGSSHSPAFADETAAHLSNGLNDSEVASGNSGSSHLMENSYTIHASRIPFNLSPQSVKRLFELNGGALEQLFVSEPFSNGLNGDAASLLCSSLGLTAKKNGGFAHLKFVDAESDLRLLQRGYISYDNSSLATENGRNTTASPPMSILSKIILTPFEKDRNYSIR